MAFLVISSALNAAFAFFMFAFAGFTESPVLQGVPPRPDFHALNAIALAAAAAVVLPWILTKRQRTRSAVFFAFLPLMLLALAAVVLLALSG